MKNPIDDPEFRSVLDAAEHTLLTAGFAVKHGFIAPALILTYTLIDALGWLSSTTAGEGVRQGFERFVTDWVMRDGDWECSATDLYAARCAVLHSLTGDSDLSSRGEARRMLYSFGSPSTSWLKDAVQASSTEEFAHVDIDQLVEAVRTGAAMYVMHAYNDGALHPMLSRKAMKFYANLKPDPLERRVSGERP